MYGNLAYRYLNQVKSFETDMQKALCIASIAIAGILFLMFLLDWLVRMPFGGNGGLLLHLGFLFSSLIVIVFGVLTLREQR